MALTTILAIYFIIWWVVLFMVLPWGVHSQGESGEVTPGTDPGAPAVHTVWRKLMWTTLIASVAVRHAGGGLRARSDPLRFPDGDLRPAAH